MKNYQSNERCLACGYLHTTYHHIKSRGSGGCDCSFNLLSVCQRHHNLIHSKGLSWMAAQYPKIKMFLVKNKYEYNPISNKWYYPIELDGCR